MNNKLSTLALCGISLSFGFGLGTALDSWPLIAPVQAHALDSSEIRRLYDDLQTGERPLVEGSRFLAKVARLTTPSVVHIQSQRRSEAGSRTVEETGSGVIVTSPKLPGMFVVTNRHVVAGATLKQIAIQLSDGRTIEPSRIWTDKATDVAVMQVSAAGLQPAVWGDSDELDIGHMVLAMGSPFGLSRSVTWGIISAKGRRSLKLGSSSDVLNQDFLQTDAAINPGNSGGPLVDLNGRIIGINTAIASNSGGNDGIGFSIPSNLVRRVVDQLLSYGRVQRAYLGVKLDPNFTASTAERLKLDRARGARVLEVYPNTPADRAKLEFDDVVLMFGEILVQDENHLINLVSLAPLTDKPIPLTILRGGRSIVLHVVLADRSELDQRTTEAP